MSTRGSRVIRGLLVAIVSLLVAAVAHVAGGGKIGAVGFALALAFSSLASIGLSGRRVSIVRVSIAVLFSQGTFHLLFGVGSSYRSDGSGHPVGMAMAGMGDPYASAQLAAVVPASSASMPDSWWMWVAHAIAAILTIAALVKGERTFWSLADWVAHSLSPVLSVYEPVTTIRRVAAVVPLEVRALGSRFLIAGVRHRGPPPLHASTGL